MPTNLVLYDLAGNGQPWSPNTLRVRLVLVYKGFKFETVFLRMQEVESTIKALGLAPGSGKPTHTVPALGYDDESGARRYIMDTVTIAQQLEAWRPQPSLGDIDRASPDSKRLRSALDAISEHVAPFLYPPYPSTVLAGDDEAIAYFIRSREPRFGCTMGELAAQATDDARSQLIASCQSLYDIFASSPGPYMHGNTPCYTDFCVASTLIWFSKLNAELFKRITDGDRSGSLRRLYDAIQPLL